MRDVFSGDVQPWFSKSCRAALLVNWLRNWRLFASHSVGVRALTGAVRLLAAHGLRRAVETNGNLLDLPVQSRRDKAAALRFLRDLSNAGAVRASW